MKNKQQPIEEEVEKTLRAIDNMDRAAPDPFFLTRVQARLDERIASKIKPIWAFRPAYMVVSLGLVLLLNLSAVVYVTERVRQHEQEQESAGFSIELGLESNGLIW